MRKVQVPAAMLTIAMDDDDQPMRPLLGLRLGMRRSVKNSKKLKSGIRASKRLGFGNESLREGGKTLGLEISLILDERWSGSGMSFRLSQRFHILSVAHLCSKE